LSDLAADVPTTFDTNSEPKVVQPIQIKVSPQLAEVVRLIQSDTDESVIVAYIENSPPYHVNAEEIVYLKDLGVTDAVISELIKHGEAVQATPVDTLANAPPTTIPLVQEPQPVAPNESASGLRRRIL
jgi:hypothetical protein